MNNEQPEALKLLERFDDIVFFSISGDEWAKAAAAELRRLHEANQEMLEVLEEFIFVIDRLPSYDGPSIEMWNAYETAKEAIRMANGETK